MATHDLIKLFDQTKIRVVWDDVAEKYYFSVMDLVQVLTDQPDRRTAAKYWSVVKTRLKQEGVELPTICSQLKLQEPILSIAWDIRSSVVIKRLITSNPKTSCRLRKNDDRKSIFFFQYTTCSSY